jgi:CubicO group peptidase (beta-lactamase class C family)
VNGLGAALDELVPEVLELTCTPGLSVAVECGGERLERGYGWADVAARRPIDTGTRFPAGSMTKLYTAVAVLQLVERGIVGLHDPVNAHLDVDCTNPLGAREITVHDLLTFRSGLAVDTTACRLTPPPPLADHVRDALAALGTQEYAGAAPRWSARVGERYQYANLGIATLGLLVERANPDGLSCCDYVHERILAPLGCAASELGDFTGPRPERLATGYACFRDLQVPTPWLRSADFPANGLITTPADHLRLLLALRDGSGLLAPATVRRMLTPQVAMDLDPASPHGWWTGLVAILANLGRRDEHFGQPGAHEWGWWNISRAYPRLGAAVVVCSNGWDMMGWHNPANPAAAAIVADEVADWLQHPRAAGERWSRRRSRLAGLIVAERTHGLLGVGERIDDGALREMAARAVGHGFDADAFMSGVRAGGRVPLDPDAARALIGGPGTEALLLDLGAAYGFPVPLWLWGDADPASRAWPSTPISAAAIAR